MAEMRNRDALEKELQLKAAKPGELGVRASLEVSNDYPDLPPATWNVVLFMMDDTGRSQMPQYDDRNRWPGSYPYPRMPFLTSKVAEGIRYTQARVNARCAPTRAAILTGRQGHRSAEHPDGNGIGDVNGNQFTSPAPSPFFSGIDANQNPWPQVVKTGTRKPSHRAGLFGKYHVYDYAATGGEPDNRNTPRDPVDAGGFHESHEVLRGVAVGAPGEESLYGYINYPYTFTNSATQTTQVAGVDLPEGNIFSPNLCFKRITYYVKQCVEEGRPFVIDWEHNLPHGLWPNFAPEQVLEHPFGTINATLYTSYTQAGLVENPAGNNGEVIGGGWDADGKPDSDPVTGIYGPQGQVHVPWRRTRVCLEATDTFAYWVDWFIRTYYPAAYAETIFMHYSDNGADVGALTPRETKEFASLGPEYANTIPPTDDGTTTGVQYHLSADAKGSVKDEGILTPLIVWGAIDEELRGTDCHRYIDATDFHPTILDLTQPDWRDDLGATEVAKIDGASFKDTLNGAATGSSDAKAYTSHCVFLPAYVDSTSDEVFEYEKAVVGTSASTNGEGYKFVRTYRKQYPSGPVTLAKDFYLYDLTNDPAELTNLKSTATGDPGSPAGLAYTELGGYYVAFFGTTQ